MIECAAQKHGLRCNDLAFIIIVHFSRLEDTLQCLESATQSDYHNYRILLLDPTNTQTLADAVAGRYPNVRVMPLKSNHGFAGNNNRGLRFALSSGAQWILLLNNDAVIAPDCLSRLIAAVQSSDVGIAGPTIYHYNEPCFIQSAGGTLGSFWEANHLRRNAIDTGEASAPRNVDYVSGCVLLAKAECIQQIGLLDERCFCYWEETEWCIRARKQGWRVVHVPAAKAWHKGAQRNHRPTPALTYYMTRNRLLTIAKHRAPAYVWAGAGLQIARTLAVWTLRPKWRHMRAHRNAMLRGIADFLAGRWGRCPDDLEAIAPVAPDALACQKPV